MELEKAGSRCGGARRWAAALALVSLAAAAPLDANAASEKSICKRERCKPQRAICLAGFKEGSKAAKALCGERPTPKDRRSCKQQVKKALRTDKKRCQSAFKDCKRCCRSSPSLACSVSACGNGRREGGEECDGADATSCSGACGSDCRCPAPSPSTVTTSTSIAVTSTSVDATTTTSGATTSTSLPTCPANVDGGPSVFTIDFGGGGDLDLGWTGVAHNAALPHGFQVVGCLAGCDLAEISKCSASPAHDATMPAPFWGPPFPGVVAGLPVCVLIEASKAMDLEVNLKNGQVEGDVSLAARIFLTDEETEPCPVCAGAVIGGTGTCSRGARAGLPCTAAGGASTDCLPAPALEAGRIEAEASLSSETVTRLGTEVCPGGSCPCSGAAAMNACDVPAECDGAVCPAEPTGPGIDQKCCERASETIGCFAGDVSRDGTREVPVDAQGVAWPGGSYPKVAEGIEIAGVLCLPQVGATTLDEALGLPGPGAFAFPAELRIDR